MTQSDKEIITKFIKAYNSFDIEGMLSLLHPDIHFINISGGEVDVEAHGKSEFEELAQNSANLFKEREQKIIRINDLVGMYEADIQYYAVLAEDLPNGLKKGEVISLRGKSEYRLRNNLIISIRDIS